MATRERRDLAKEQFWRRMLRRWQSSRLSVRDFCAKHHLTQSSFYFWRRTIAQRDQEASTSSAETRHKGNQSNSKVSNDKPHADALPLFVPVNLPAAKLVPISSTERPIEVVLDSGVLVRVPVGFDDGTLRQLLALLAKPIEEEPTC